MSARKIFTHPDDCYYYNNEYSITRWRYHDKANGCYYLVCMNGELYKMQGNISPHVVCIVDNFGNLVRKP